MPSIFAKITRTDKVFIFNILYFKISVHKPPMRPPPGSQSHININGEPSEKLQHLSLSVLDAFGSVHDILQQTDLKHASLTKSIETMPLPSCHDSELLMLKATSQAALHSMESALNILQDLRDLQIHTTATRHHQHKSVVPLGLSPKKGGFLNLSHQDLRPTSPNLSACGSPTRNELLSGGGDTVSVKSAAALVESNPLSHKEGAKANLSVSTSELDQAGQKS